MKHASQRNPRCLIRSRMGPRGQRGYGGHKTVDSTSSSMGEKTFVYKSGTKRSLIIHITCQRDSIVGRSLVSHLVLTIWGKANFSSTFHFKNGVSNGVNRHFWITHNTPIQVSLRVFHWAIQSCPPTRRLKARSITKYHACTLLICSLSEIESSLSQFPYAQQKLDIYLFGWLHTSSCVC